LLDAAAQALVADERELLSDLRQALQRHGAASSDLALLDTAMAQLDELFLLVIIGEFNAGKSAVLNVLLGHDVLQEGVTPTTSRITIVRYGEQVGGPTLTPAGIAEVTAPVDLLRDLHVVDTPGTNAVLREHEVLTSAFVPRADLVVFITSADRPFTESERAFLERVRNWGKKMVFVVNKADILASEAELAAVLEFVRANARTLLGVEPPVFAVSARWAKEGRKGDEDRWTASRFGAFERYLLDTLDQAERLRLKLSNPVGVAERLAAGLEQEVGTRLHVLDDDAEALEQVDRQLALHLEDLTREFAFRMADIEKVLVEMERRGHDHFDETIRFGRIVDLMNKERMQQLFEQQVIADTPQRIDRKVGALIDWLVDADFRQWQAINELLAERRTAHRDRLGRVPELARFEHDRSRLIESVGREAERIVDTYDRTTEAATLAEKARGAVAASAALEVGAVGLGAVVAAVATTAAADMTGLAITGVMATVGLLVIPRRRRQAKQELREKVTVLKDRLAATLRGAFEGELQRSGDRVRHHLEPYSRFVRSERQHLGEGQRVLRELGQRFDALRHRIQAAA
jgi:small GTP-binding protein